MQAVRKALHEITVPLVGSTVTPVVVFLPLIAVTGVTGSFFRALAITMTVSLLTSLALALTWTPSLSLRCSGAAERAANRLMPDEMSDDRSQLPDAQLMHQQARSWATCSQHQRASESRLSRPLWLARPVCVLVVGTYFAYQSLGSDLLAGDG